MKYHAIIIDDEPIAHDVITEHVIKSGLKITLKSFFNAATAIDYLQKNAVDIIFLDIQMPQTSGIDLLKNLATPPVTIFTTAHRDYAFEGYELGVIDYLLKPITYNRFLLSINRTIEFINLKRRDDEFMGSETIHHLKKITIRSSNKIISVDINSISHIQGLKDYVIFYTSEKKYVVKGYIKLIIEMLPQGYFTRVHKSFIVATSKIKLLNKGKIEFDNFQIPVGRVYKKEVEALFC